jgi:ATP-dependent DNA helicase RecG
MVAGRRALAEARAALAEAVRGGARAYLVCPLVEASQGVDASDVEAAAVAMAALLPDKVVAIVHGRLRSEEKQDLLGRFAAGAIDVLVATTVIEVGVDVPEANAILVEHAERFGLAQLHQLRGRVGRDDGTRGAARCLLHTAFGPTSDPARRLRVLVEHTDGFVIAERDLEWRGPGEVFGTRQSGVPGFRFAGVTGEGMALLEAARASAQRLIEADPALAETPRLRELVEAREAAALVVGGEAG